MKVVGTVGQLLFLSRRTFFPRGTPDPPSRKRICRQTNTLLSDLDKPRGGYTWYCGNARQGRQG